MKKSIIIIMMLFWIVISCNSPEADVVFFNGDVYTMEEDQPWAEAVAIKNGRIIAVSNNSDLIKKFVGSRTRTVDLQGRFLMPGFIDAHVHFNRAGALINDANLMAVADNEGLRREMERVCGIIGPGEWITGGLWGAYEEWERGADVSRGRKSGRWQPHRKVIDDLTADNPCLLNSYDYELYLANSTALSAAGLLAAPVEGMQLYSDGSPSGLIRKGSPALGKVQETIKPKSRERLLNENRAALKKLARCGIVEVHDIAAPEQTGRFVELQKNGELTCRVWLRPDLSRGEELIEKGMTMGLHPETGDKDGRLRYGALKGYIDGIMGTHGALFF